MLVIFDLDGTLSLSDHRDHLVRRDPPDWDAFYAACSDDEPNWPAIRVLRALARGDDHQVEVWTGRREDQRSATLEWFHRYGVPSWVELEMRPVGDRRPDVALKEQWLGRARARRRLPDLVFEDRDRVVAMWREAGVPCFQVAPGGF